MKSIWPHLEGKTHIIWDWNGTLLDDVELMISVIGDILEEHSLNRIDRKSYTELFAFPVKDYYRSLGFNFAKTPFEDLSDKFIQGYRQGLSKTRLHEGMKDFLCSVHQSKISQSVLSAAQQTYLEEQLNHFGVRHYFEHVYGINDFHAASKLERGKELMVKTKIPKETTILIGDTDHDLEVGKALGVEVLLLADGHQSYPRLQGKHHRILKSRY